MMTTITLSTQTSARPWLVGFAWGAMLLMSRLPQIVLKELFAIETPYAWTWFGVAATLLAITYLWSRLQPLRNYLLIMAAMALLTGPFDSLLRNSTLWTTWFSQERGWTISFLGERLLLVLEAWILIGVLISAGIQRQAFFLAVGKLRAQAVGLRLPGIGSAWLLVGPLLALLLTLCFFLGTAALNGVPLTALPRVLPWLPAILLFALMNAFGEELIYRAAPLSPLWQVIGSTQAIWLTAIWFGLGHYYGGNLGGAVYTRMAGSVAILFGKAMVETRDIVLPMLMHMLINAAIYLFLALDAVGAA
jgi:membrane protease YdiL (CAAX protease family)